MFKFYVMNEHHLYIGIYFCKVHSTWAFNFISSVSHKTARQIPTKTEAKTLWKNIPSAHADVGYPQTYMNLTVEMPAFVSACFSVEGGTSRP